MGKSKRSPLAKSPRLKRWGFRFVALLMSTTIALLLGEVVVRIVRPQSLVQTRSDIWIPADRLGHRLAPNVNTTISTGERTVQFLTDDCGHRISASGTKEGGVRVLALGDSFVEALAVEYEQTMTARLEQHLPDVTVVNAGVSATSPDGYLLRAQWELERESFDHVLVFVYPDNDVRRERRASYPPRKKSLRRPLRLPKKLNTREFTDALIYPVYTELRTRSHLAVLVKDTMINQLIRFGLTATELPAVYQKSEKSSPGWALTADICADIALEARSHGASTLFILLPADYAVDESIGNSYIKSTGLDPADVDMQQPTELLANELKSRQLRVVDTTGILKSALSEGVRPYGRIDRHFNPDGHELVAKSITPVVAEMLAANKSLATN